MNAKDLIQQITDQVHKNANVRVVFGEPITKENVTIIPVAKVIVKGGGGGGFGGPGGSVSLSAGFISQAQSQAQRLRPEEKRSESADENSKASEALLVEDKMDPSSGGGMGMGLQVETIPLGYIEIQNGVAKYREIVDATKIALSGMAMAGFMVMMVMRMITTFSRLQRQKRELEEKRLKRQTEKK